MNDASKSSVIAYVVGMSRGGTSFVMNCLNSHPDVVCFGEALYWGREYLEPNGEGRYSPNQVELIYESCLRRKWSPGATAGTTILGQEEPLATALESRFADVRNTGGTPREVFDLIADAFCHVHGKQMAIEKTPHHVHFISRIQESYPSAKFVAMQRDPFEFLLSYKFQGAQKDESVRELFSKIYHPILASIICRNYLKSFLDVKRRHPEAVRFFNTNELKENAAEVYQNILEFLGLPAAPFAPGKIDSNSSFSDQVRPELEPIDLFWLNLIAGRLISQSGYVCRDSRVSIGDVVVSLLKLPASVYFVLRTVMPRQGKQLRYLFRLLR